MPSEAGDPERAESSRESQDAPEGTVRARAKRRPARMAEQLGERRARHRRRSVPHRAATAVAGFLVVLAGIALSAPGVPGPGLVVILVGLGMLALEFDWAERLLRRGLRYFDELGGAGLPHQLAKEGRDGARRRGPGRGDRGRDAPSRDSPAAPVSRPTGSTPRLRPLDPRLRPLGARLHSSELARGARLARVEGFS